MQTRFLYYYSVYVNLFKELFLYVACRCISEKRVQRYRLFQYPPNIFGIIFQKCFKIDVCQAERANAATQWRPIRRKKTKMPPYRY